jgi:hypothetical protein
MEVCMGGIRVDGAVLLQGDCGVLCCSSGIRRRSHQPMVCHVDAGGKLPGGVSVLSALMCCGFLGGNAVRKVSQQPSHRNLFGAFQRFWLMRLDAAPLMLSDLMQATVDSLMCFHRHPQCFMLANSLISVSKIHENPLFSRIDAGAADPCGGRPMTRSPGFGFTRLQMLCRLSAYTLLIEFQISALGAVLPIRFQSERLLTDLGTILDLSSLPLLALPLLFGGLAGFARPAPWEWGLARLLRQILLLAAGTINR